MGGLMTVGMSLLFWNCSGEQYWDALVFDFEFDASA